MRRSGNRKALLFTRKRQFSFRQTGGAAPDQHGFSCGRGRSPSPLPSPPGRGERGGNFGEISTRPVSSHREERFSNNSSRKSGAAAESNPVKPSQIQSNQIFFTASERPSPGSRRPTREKRLKLPSEPNSKTRVSDCAAND